MKFRTYNDLIKLINRNIHRIPSDIQIVIGIPRSGMLVASIIALDLNLPLTDIDSFIEGKTYSSGVTKVTDCRQEKVSDIKKALVVDDSVATGRAILEAKEKLCGIKDIEFVYFCAYATEESKSIIDIYFELCNPPRLFEWNYMHNRAVSYMCFDIDGVLCDDPTEEQNDDGEKYIDFLRNAPLRVRPTFTVECLVTSRLEKYRKETETWLAKNNIKYNQLIMMQFNTKEERLKSGSHGAYKAQVYKKMKQTNMFVESSRGQAEEIAKITGKAVFCIENERFYAPGIKFEASVKAKNLIAKLVPRRLVSLINKFR